MLAKNFDEIRRMTQLSEANVVQKLEDFKSIDRIVITNLKEQEDQILQKLRDRKRDSFIKGVSRSDDSYRKRHSALPGSFNFRSLLMDANVSAFDTLRAPPEQFPVVEIEQAKHQETSI
jgi:hypothetical protein